MSISMYHCKHAHYNHDLKVHILISQKIFMLIDMDKVVTLKALSEQ